MHRRLALLSALLALPLSGEANDDAAVRFEASLLATPLGTKISATLVNGEKVEGELAEAGDEFFGVWVEPDESMQERLNLPSAKVKKTIRYEDVKELSGAREPTLSGGKAPFPLRAGDSIRVRAADGSNTRGRVEAFDGDLLRVDSRSFRLSDGSVERIDMVIHDPLKNGVLIGFGIGAGWAGLSCAAGGCDGGSTVAGVLILGGAGAGLGALFDSLRTKSEIVYLPPSREPSKRLSFAPLLTRDAKGLLVMISF
jgi:hypothetical protein